METLRLSKEDLLSKYADTHWRSNFYEATHLVGFLSKSILAENYKIPDELPQLIPLTDLGSEVMNKLVRKNEVNPKVARLLCLLQLIHREPLVDFSAVQPEALRRFIDSQIRERQLLFPFVLGRDLYDRAATLFEEPRSSLSHTDTLELLDELPVGVFQSGPFVSGPFGLLRSSQERWFGATTSVPMYHCAELTCSLVHRSRLSSDHAAPINEHRSTMRRVLDSYGNDESDWGEFLELAHGIDGIEFDDRTKEPITLALGDLFGDDELRVILSDLLDNSGGELRTMVEPLGLIGRSADIVESLARAQTIQLILLARNQQIQERIDHLILRRPDEQGSNDLKISIGAGEVRRLMTNRRSSFGIFGVYPEVSSLGIRYKSDSFALGSMRLTRLVGALYDLDDPTEVSELEWQLRGVDGTDPQEKIEEFVQLASPEEAVHKLVLTRLANQTKVAGEVGLRYADYGNDNDFARAVLWKLGFYAQDVIDPTSDFWNHHGRLKRFVDTAGVGSRVDIDDLRSKAINCFVSLEGVLDDALAYTGWALLVDHLAAPHPFAYAPRKERGQVFAQINGANAQKTGPGPAVDKVQLAEKNTLGTLIQGFASLATLLDSHRSNSQSFNRLESQYPRWAHHTELKKFSFRHTVPFLDLLPQSQLRILETLNYVSKTLSAAETASVRNDFGHYRSTPPELTRVELALVAMDRVVRRIEGDGLVRLPFEMVRTEGDNWGRKVHTLRDAKGREVAFARPSAFDWNQMPSLRGAQYIMPAAIFARPNEMLRFRAIHDTSYGDYWTRFPRRRRRQGAVNDPSETLDTGIPSPMPDA